MSMIKRRRERRRMGGARGGKEQKERRGEYREGEKRRISRVKEKSSKGKEETIYLQRFCIHNNVTSMTLSVILSHTRPLCRERPRRRIF